MSNYLNMSKDPQAGMNEKRWWHFPQKYTHATEVDATQLHISLYGILLIFNLI